MKKLIAFILVLVLTSFIVAFSSVTISNQINIPEGLNSHEAEIYTQGYLDGYYAAQHGVIDERHPENAPGHYVININSGKFHYPSCNGVQSMNVSNRDDFYGSRDELIEKGYEPCGSCDP